jgi:hypothetical protein
MEAGFSDRISDVGGKGGQMWAGSEMLAKLTDAQVRSARWEG